MAGAGDAEPAAQSPTAPGWVERHLRIPAEAYPQLRPLLGWLAMVHDVDIRTPNGVPTDETVAVYNEQKVVWVDDPDPDGLGIRPMIPFGRILDQTAPDKGQAAARLVGTIKSAVSRLLYQGGAVDKRLLGFVHVQPTPNAEFPYDVQGLYADRAVEFAQYRHQVVAGIAHEVGADGFSVLQEYCRDLVLPRGHRA
jgi:hypothetical protein